jgi:hypothetical protein
LEKTSFKRTVSELTDEFELDSLADKILVERAAMYLVRVARAEAYEAGFGPSQKLPTWGNYISKLDNTMRGLLSDLAVTRAKRKQLEKSDSLLVSVDDVLKKFVRAERIKEPSKGRVKARRIWVNSAITDSLWVEWRKETAEYWANRNLSGVDK